MFSVHCFEGLQVKNCLPCINTKNTKNGGGGGGRRRRRASGSEADSSGVVVTRTVQKHDGVSGGSSSSTTGGGSDSHHYQAHTVRRRSDITVAAPAEAPPGSATSSGHRAKRHKHSQHRFAGGRRRRLPLPLTALEAAIRAGHPSDTQSVHETLAMVNTVDNWMACVAQAPVDFSLPARASSVCGVCLVNAQRAVVHMSGMEFAGFMQSRDASLSSLAAETHVASVFEPHFGALIQGLVDRCIEQLTATAIRIVHQRMPYNILAYPVVVRGAAEGVLLVWREDSVSPAAFGNLIVSAS